MSERLFIGDIIRDVEDSDCYYEGIITSINPIKYKITNIIWCGKTDSSMNNEIIEPKWWYLTKLEI